MKVKLKDIRKSDFPKDRWKKLKRSIRKHQRIVTLDKIVKSNGIDDTIWIIGNKG